MTDLLCPHCATSVDEHEAGRETDACVAEAVMKQHKWQFADVSALGFSIEGALDISIESQIRQTPHYSTDIAAAWEVVGRLLDNEFDLDYDNEYRCFFAGDNNFGLADTAPLAICRAALKAVHA